MLTTTTVSPTSCNFQYTTFDNLVENEDHYQAYGKFNFDVTDDAAADPRCSMMPGHSCSTVTRMAWFPAYVRRRIGARRRRRSPIPAAGTGEQVPSISPTPTRACWP